jgi:hypothetical protein
MKPLLFEQSLRLVGVQHFGEDLRAGRQTTGFSNFACAPKTAPLPEVEMPRCLSGYSDL